MKRPLILYLSFQSIVSFSQGLNNFQNTNKIKFEKASLQNQSFDIRDTPKQLEIENKNYNYIGSYKLADHFISKITEFDKLRYQAVSNYEDLYKRINIYKINIDSFDLAYSKIQILNSSIKDHVLSLTFKYGDRTDTAFAYFKPGFYNVGKKVGIHIIPGSGINQSSAMFYKEKKNYQSNIVDIVQSHGDLFILVKPNEDFLAIHNGIKKINESSFVNYLLNNGSSYSAYYMIQSLAVSKFIQNKYEALYVCGLSQGGLAALINALQSHPQKAIIASGYSVLMDHPYMSAQDQLIIPDYKTLNNSEHIKIQIQKMNTQFLFTWGIQENGFYGIDAKDRLTSNFFKDLKNVKSMIHPLGHIYYEPVITEFLGIKALRPNRNF